MRFELRKSLGGRCATEAHLVVFVSIDAGDSASLRQGNVHAIGGRSAVMMLATAAAGSPPSNRNESGRPACTMNIGILAFLKLPGDLLV